MIIYDTIRVVIVKIPTSQYSHSFIYDHLENEPLAYIFFAYNRNILTITYTC